MERVGEQSLKWTSEGEVRGKEKRMKEKNKKWKSQPDLVFGLRSGVCTYLNKINSQICLHVLLSVPSVESCYFMENNAPLVMLQRNCINNVIMFFLIFVSFFRLYQVVLLFTTNISRLIACHLMSCPIILFLRTYVTLRRY